MFQGHTRTTKVLPIHQDAEDNEAVKCVANGSTTFVQFCHRTSLHGWAHCLRYEVEQDMHDEHVTVKWLDFF